MELNKIITPKVGKCFKEKSSNGSSQKLIVIGKDLSIGIVECLLLDGSYSYAYAYMDEIHEKRWMPIKRVKGVSVKKNTEFLEDDDVFISRIGTNIKFKNNLCLTFSSYSSMCLKYQDTVDERNFAVLHGKKKKAMIKRIMRELRVEINNKPSLKKKYRELKEKDEDEIIRLYRERYWGRNDMPYGLCLLEKKFGEEGNIITRLIRKFTYLGATKVYVRAFIYTIWILINFLLFLQCFA